MEILRSRLKLSASKTIQPPPLPSASTTATSSSSSGGSEYDYDESPTPPSSRRYYDFPAISLQDPEIPRTPVSGPHWNSAYKSVGILSGHVGAVSCIALCGEFILSASQGKDIIVWQQPVLRRFTTFGQGDGAVKALLTVGNRVLTAHQDSRIRVWRVSRSSENVFKLVDTLPTKKDFLCKFMRQSNYVQTRRHHKKLWIEHADSISCLAVQNGYIYSGSWDKTLKVWRMSDLKCVESINAHDDAINALVAGNGTVYSASADGKIKAWGTTEHHNKTKTKTKNKNKKHSLKAVLEGHEDVSLNSVVVSDDGNLVYGAGSDGFVMGWVRNSEKWETVCEVRAHEMSVLCLEKWRMEFLCSGSADRSIGIWKMENGGKLCKFLVINGHEGPIRCLQAYPVCVVDGFMLYSGSLDRSLRIWWVPVCSDQTQKPHLMI